MAGLGAKPCFAAKSPLLVHPDYIPPCSRSTRVNNPFLCSEQYLGKLESVHAAVEGSPASPADSLQP